MIYDLVSIGSITKDIFILSDRGKIFKTPKDKLATAWLAFELGEKICIDKIRKNLGGVATNLAVGTKKMGIKSVPMGTISNDAEGNWILNEFKKGNIDPNLTKVAPKGVSPVSILIVDKKTGERVIFYETSSGQVDLSALSKIKAQWLYVSSLTGNCRKQVSSMVAYGKKHGARLVTSPSTSQIRNDYENLKRLLAATEIVFLNRNEAIEIAFNEKEKDTSIKSLKKLLHKLGPKIVCITDGTKGASCSDGKKIYLSPIKKVKTVDVTGAGDAFAAGFLGFFLKGKSLKDSLKAGIINSASVVQYIGTTKGLLTKKQILSQLK